MKTETKAIKELKTKSALVKERSRHIEGVKMIFSPHRTYFIEPTTRTLKASGIKETTYEVTYRSAGETMVLGVFDLKTFALSMIAIDISRLEFYTRYPSHGKIKRKAKK